MTTYESPRLGVTRWTSDKDSFTRDHMESSNAALEATVMGYQQGTSRPDPTEALAGFLYWNTATSVLSYCDGTTWVDTNDFGSAQDLVIGGSNINGVASSMARSDHTHTLPGYGSAVSLDGTGSAGVAATFARSDHKHSYDALSIDGADIANESILNSKLTDNCIGASEMSNDSVTSTVLANNAINSSTLIADNTVTDSDIVSLSASKLTGGTANMSISGNASTATKWATNRSWTFSGGKFTSGAVNINADLSPSFTLTANLSSSDIPTLAASKVDAGTGNNITGSSTVTFPGDVRVPVGSEVELNLSSANYVRSLNNQVEFVKSSSPALNVHRNGLLFPGVTPSGPDTYGQTIAFRATSTKVYTYVNGVNTGIAIN